MKNLVHPRIRAAVTALALGATFAATTALPVVAQPFAVEYKVQYKIKKSGFRSVRMLGGSAYICTPSGFGQKGRCYLRNPV